MNESESENPNRIMFKKENFGEYMEEIYYGLIKNYVLM